jgi:ATP-dependent DNA ligase
MRQDLVEANSLIADTELRIARQGEIIAELFAGGHSTGKAVSKLNLRSTILDGEIVALNSEGIPRFRLLQKWQKRPTAPVKACGEVPEGFELLRSSI